MALGFIKKIFSFGKEEKPATPVEEAKSGALADDGLPEAAETLIVPDHLDREDEENVASELEAQADSIAAFEETIEEEPATTPEDSNEPVAIQEPIDDSDLPEAAETLIIPDQLDEQDNDLADEADAQADSVAEFSQAIEDEEPPTAEPSTPVAPIIAEPESPKEWPESGERILPAGFASAADRIAQTDAPVEPERRRSWLERLRSGLARTSAQLTSQITSLFTKRKLDDETLQDLEDLLIQADLGVETALRITDTLASERYGKDVSGEDVTRIMAGEITKALSPVAKPLELDLKHKPHVILVVGVNGTGKTTTIGKLAAKLTRSGLKVMLAAGDTFRAAAIEQLHIWANRTGADIVSTKLGADAAGLAYEAYEKALASGHDVLIIDTAGRLQNKTELMAELEKIVRVLGKLDPDAPHTVLQTLDATTGQNALSQVEIFRNIAGVSGLIMTKLDGTARGGILVAISAKHKLPVYFIGVGEGVDDLEPFNARDFAEAIAGIPANK